VLSLIPSSPPWGWDESDMKTIHLGRFEDIEDAARAYKQKALKLFQEYLGET